MDIVQRGQQRYEAEIRGFVEAQNRGKILALDIETGDYEIADDSLDALEVLKSRKPEAKVYILRVGYSTAVKIGTNRLVMKQSR